MKMNQLNSLFTDLGNEINKLDDINGIDSKVGYTYKTINKEMDIGFDENIKTTINSSSKRLRMDIEIPTPKKKEIKKKKIKGINAFERITKQGKKLAKDLKKIGLDNKKGIRSKLKTAKSLVVRVVKNEGHRIKENVKDECNNVVNKLGIETYKTWHCIFKNSRDTHKAMHLQIADKEGYFHSSAGGKTKYPGGFGDPSEDINCQCYIRIERKG
ncbi:MAG: hypothetical protein A3K77_06310 [Euryarchaeota archaeon RBG_13_31_8]|nr:MAG: hypothetical protein A3K77_06310 [Euryarchaeota archaeon RBG_13_31_8]